MGEPRALESARRVLAQRPALSIAGEIPLNGLGDAGPEFAEGIRALRPDEVILLVSADGRFHPVLVEVLRTPVPVRLLPPAAIPSAGRMGRWGRWQKRLLDLALGLPLTLLTLPLMLLIGLAIAVSSGWPVLFRQWRVGEGGRLFGMYKFRTMHARAGDPLGMEAKRPDDPRVTPIGRWLRRMSLDELPQLLNVLLGQMSLVGPRPELPGVVLGYQGEQWLRLTVPQGLTGLWQVKKRPHPMHAHTDLDLEYIREWSLALDLKILLQTPWAVLRGEGAY